MNLTSRARTELKELLRTEMAPVEFAKLDDEAVNEIGVSLLRLTSIALRQHTGSAVHGSGVFVPEVDTPES